jgi:hypothetical protein
MKIDTKAILIITSITAIDFLSDIITYSIGVSKSQGKGFGLHFPEFKDVVKIVAVGAVCGVMIDLATKGVTKVVEAPQELKLAALVAKEKTEIEKGNRKNQNPERVVWQPTQS